MITLTMNVVTPIVGFLGDFTANDIKHIKFNPTEIEEVFSLTIEQLTDPKLQGIY